MIQTVREKNRYESPLSEVVMLRLEAILNGPSDTTPINPNPGDDQEVPL